MKWEDVDLQPYTKEQVKQRDNQLKEWHEKQKKLKDKVQLNSGERLIWNGRPLKNAEGKYNEYVNCPYCWYKNYVSTKKKKNKGEKREC